MTAVTSRLVQCFQRVFPELPSAQVLTASTGSVAAWDTVRMNSLVRVIEAEFGVDVGLDRLGELSSFDDFRAYVEGRLAGMR